MQSGCRNSISKEAGSLFLCYIMLGFTKLEFSRRKTRTNLIIWTFIIGTVLILFAMIDSFYLHLLDTLQRHDHQNCAMSYAYPTFTEIENKPNSTFSNKYKLYLYREGYVDRSDQVIYF